MKVGIEDSLFKTYYIHIHFIFRVFRTHDSLRIDHIVNSHINDKCDSPQLLLSISSTQVQYVSSTKL